MDHTLIYLEMLRLSNLFAHPVTSRKFKEIYKFNGNNTLTKE